MHCLKEFSILGIQDQVRLLPVHKILSQIIPNLDDL